MGVGMLRRYHTQAQAVTETGGTVESDNGSTPEPPAGNASQADWADWVIATHPELEPDSVRAIKRDDLREQYGPKAE